MRARQRKGGEGGEHRLYKENFRYHHLTQVLAFVTRAQEIPECNDRCESYSNQNVLPFSKQVINY